MNLRIFLMLFVIGITNAIGFAQTKNLSQLDSIYASVKFGKEQHSMSQKNTKEASAYFLKGANYFKKKKDTFNYLLCIIYLSDIELRKGQFNKAFDLLWEVLPIAEEISNKKPLYKIHQMLGILYTIFNKKDVALQHTKKGLQLAKEYTKTSLKDSTALISSYLDVAVQYVEMKQYNVALRYLDSCYFSYAKNERLFFVDGVYGLVYLKKKEYAKSEFYLRGVIPYMEKNDKGFQGAVNYYFAELKYALNQTDSAIYYYKKALKSIDSLQSNQQLKPQVLEKLANSYVKKQQHEKAFLFMKEAKKISDSLFISQGKQNRILFEIKNKFKEDNLIKEEKIQFQNRLISLNNKAKLRLQIIIGVLILLVIVGIATYKLRLKLKKVAYEQALNNEKNTAILEHKNKELTANALQIIEKEQAVKELLDTILENAPKQHKLLALKYKQSTKKIWKEFNLRFTEINQSFYNKLLDLHPNLTAIDLKYCALIKLNFDSKEMSHLLGISINSVHMARSRIRRKLDLKRDESLSSYIQTL